MGASKFWIGTSGWSYYHWRGRFYPQDLPSWQWFHFYIDHFRTVELNASFYRQPQKRTWQGWQRSAPAGFRFAVKANRFITHIKRLKECRDPLQTFLEGASLLGDKLGPILYQLPPSFHCGADNLQRLGEFLPLLPAHLQHVIEFRHASWFRDEVLALLRQHNVAFCSYDMVDVECPLVATAPFAYLRFHGAEARYASNYSEEMLQEWAARLGQLAPNLTSVYVYFNNDYNAYAVYNAKRLAEVLGETERSADQSEE
ncbi:MAG: DUF72 domain-containing protein [Dehalococcoidia bacterium]